MVHAQQVADLAQVLVLPFEGKLLSPAGNFEFLNRGQQVENFFCNAVGKIFLLFVGADVDEWQYSDGLARSDDLSDNRLSVIAEKKFVGQ